jgi:hypothetical protein
MLTMFYAAFYGIWHAETLLDSLGGLLKNIGIFLAQKPYGVTVLIFAPNIFAASWFVLFIKQITAQDFGFSALYLLLLSGLIQLIGIVISSLPGIGIFPQFGFIVGFILLGFTLALSSRQFWNMAKKEPGVEKLVFYSMSIGFPIMYVVLIQKIF